jgi:hypothetical protein
MAKSRALAAALAALLVFVSAGPVPLHSVTLKKPPGPGRLFPAGAETVKVFPIDERGELILSAGFEGGVETASGFYGFWSRIPNAVPDLLAASSKDAVEASGMRWGSDGLVLSLTVRDLRIENFHREGGPELFFAYIRLEAKLQSGDAQELRTSEVKLAECESSPADPGDALSRLLARAAWKATAGSLLGFFPRNPEPEAVGRLIALLPSRDPVSRERAASWLAFASGENVAGALLFALREEEDLGAFDAEAAALAAVGSSQGRGEIAQVLAGKIRWKHRDPVRVEDAWVLLHALALMGETDLESKLPAVREGRGRLTDLVRFDMTGKVPAASPEEAQGRARFREWITGKK